MKFHSLKEESAHRLIMMKLTLSVHLIWILLSSAEALKCYHKSWEPSWEDPTSCASPDEQCAGIAADSDMMTLPSMHIKVGNCTAPSLCSAIERQISFTYGSSRVATSGYCCNTDGCNNRNVKVSDVQTRNGLQCFTCSGPQDTVCDTIVQCVGIQNRCFKSIMSMQGKTGPVLGCVSANLCEGNIEGERSLFSMPVQILSAPQCCGTSLCNSAPTFRLSVVPVLLGLVALSAN
ncbi:phospholipase A2 inhibitor and Ly6/PLAUR domain-containing protein-like [Xyrichtys novacula]|uniref:Phospholipase A2 inhibitor and Ly6/PLAUR domain-containing protein-like n=1 Tax=Xyrichtys novacula TaxID=13765 RepID=A0AAV1FEF8_XYRNO|nr:phospholipase A2 inhibitor and Ly6/PLAUR domain-containing protein-like [Xyrichtys novacula]